MSQEIISAISAVIASNKRLLLEEWTKSDYEVNECNNQIRNLREKIKRLKAIRDELETIFYGEGEEKK